MDQKFFETLKPWAMLPLRLSLGAIFFAHGSQKLLGWFGGSGLGQTLANFGDYLGIPPYLAVAAILTEFLGSLMVLIGLKTRWAALGLSVVMLVAIFKVHLPNGFFLNWFALPGQGHGIEYNLALLGGCLALILGGPGPLALDRLLCKCHPRE